MANLADRLDHLLGNKAAATLATEFGMQTVEDLLRHYPLRYATPGQPLTAEAPAEGSRVTIVGTVTKADLVAMRSRKGKMLKVVVDTGGQGVHATFFNGHKVSHSVKTGRRAMFSGTVKYWRNGWELSHPGYLILPQEGSEVDRVQGGGDLAGMARSAHDGAGVDMSIFDRAFLPVYPATSKIESWDVYSCVRQVLDQLDPVHEVLPQDLRDSLDLIGLDEALRTIHQPDTKDQIARAEARLKFDEAAAMQLLLAVRRQDAVTRTAPACPPRPDGVAAAFDAALPFELTTGQTEVAAEIAHDLAQPHPMSRLLQGEVGSGKTIVALRAMLQVVDAGYQCALLAPTEVLAAQHYRSLRAMLGALGTAGELGAADPATSLVLVTGSMSVGAKREALLKVVSGDAGIVIGTHALLQTAVEFFDLGMVVVDEQHRFGVEQRDALRAKAREGVSPHQLVMTATPIPRTIAMTVLGDLVTSTLRELPRGRSPIDSKVVPARDKPAWVERAWARIREEVEAGRQAYVVCSRIGDEESEADTAAVVDMYEELRHGALAGVRVGLLHGRLPADEKDAVMRAFNAATVDVLVCTTVVEVGVDVPNATVMVIYDADRFGVSQLHQLRGRVGRGKHPGLCILVTQMPPGSPPFVRLTAVAGTNDGFTLAELDLAQRREGDVLGSAQSGTATNVRLLSLLDDLETIEAARQFAQSVVGSDPGLAHHPELRRMSDAAVSEQGREFLGKS